MQILDWILLGLLLLGTFRGWCSGLVKQVVAIGGFVAGLVAAALWYQPMSQTISPWLGTHAHLASVLAFVLIWIAVAALLDAVGALLSSLLNKTVVLGTTNRVLGALLGLVKYALMMGLLLWALKAVKVLPAQAVEQSVCCGELIQVPQHAYTKIVETNGRQATEE